MRTCIDIGTRMDEYKIVDQYFLDNIFKLIVVLMCNFHKKKYYNLFSTLCKVR